MLIPRTAPEESWNLDTPRSGLLLLSEFTNLYENDVDLQAQVDAINTDTSGKIDASLLTTKGDIIARNASGPVRVPVGAAREIVIADPVQDSGLAYTNLDTEIAAVTGPIGTRVAALEGLNGAIVFQEQQTSGTNGGTFTSGGDVTRVLNTTVDPLSLGFATLASNQISLTEIGTYEVKFSAPCLQVDAHQAWLYNVSDAAVAFRGVSGFSANAGNTDRACGIGLVTIAAAPKVFELRHRCTVTANNIGLGRPASLGTEIYSIVEIRKISD